MNIAFGLLGFLVRRLGIAGVLLLVGWYAGAKYGAPGYLTPLADPLFNRAEAAIATLLGSEPEAGDESSSDQ